MISFFFFKVDFGCAECKLVINMKRLPYVHEIVGVDIDQYLLEDCQRRTEPLFFDYIEPRPFTPIDLVSLFSSFKYIRLIRSFKTLQLKSIGLL